MAGHFYAPPLLAQHTFLVEQEGAAFDAKVLLAVELFQFDDVKQLAQGFIFV